MRSKKFTKGMVLFEKIHGGLSAEETIKTLDSISPTLSRLSVELIFGDLYSNDCLSLKTREMLNIAGLVVAGNAIPQLENHIRAAIKLGCTQEEIVEIMLQMIIIVGFPAVVNAMCAAKKIFDETKI